MRVPETQYATPGDATIAYQVVGDGIRWQALLDKAGKIDRIRSHACLKEWVKQPTRNAAYVNVGFPPARVDLSLQAYRRRASRASGRFVHKELSRGK
jgi:hypothetical protein